MPDWRAEVALRLTSLKLDPAHEAAMITELAQHLEEHYQDLLAQGESQANAKRAALAGLDDSRVLRELRGHIEDRQGARLATPAPAQVPAGNFREAAAEFLKLETLLYDFRYALRTLRKSAGFSAIAILTIALGIGTTTAIFSVVDATLLHPLPYPHPEQLVSIVDDLPGLGSHDVGLSQPEWQDLQHSGIFEYVSPAWFDENNLTGGSRPMKVRILIVAPNYFALLGVKPQLGRTFDPEDHSPGLLPEVVISDGLWKRDFGGDPHVLDKSIRMDTDLYHIVGVMPPGFDAPSRSYEERNIEIWPSTNFYGLPMVDHPPRKGRNLPTAIARLKSGLTLQQAQQRLDVLAATLRQEYPADYPAQSGWQMRLVPLQETMVGNVRQPLLLLLGAVALVLLIGCVNVANLLLARATVRQREFGIRQALGASHARLIRQLLTESLVLSLLGTFLGIAILFGAKSFLLRVVPETLPRATEIAIRWPVLLFSVALALVAGIVFGLAPAFESRRMNVTQALRLEGRSATSSVRQTRARRALVITEFALSLVLMTSATLLLRSFWDLLRVPLGFNAENVISVRTRQPYPNDPKIDKYATNAQESVFVRELLRRLQALPGVSEAALGDSAALPLDEAQQQLNVIAEGRFFFDVEGHPIQADQPRYVARTRVTPEYFRLLGLPLLEGRVFTDEDTDQAPPVAVVNQAFARTYWPGEDAVGHRFRSTRSDAPWVTIVGIIADARTQNLTRGNLPQVYASLYQNRAKHLAIFLRGHFDPGSIPEQVRREVQAIDDTLPVFGAQQLKDTVSGSLAERRFSMNVIALFALAALLLAALGIYGVISYSVNARRQEFGVRMALGAQRGNVLRLVLAQGLGLGLRGTAVGFLAALLVTRTIAGLLYGVKPTDPLTFIAVATVLLVVSLLACFIPARRATKADPMLALRDA
ncbi:MAG: ABC transporter permease [Acidobacteria bacterium]|nr:ABC transporter permease [Acidobacteriota bacterium]